MTKQEEIREGIQDYIDKYGYSLKPENLMVYLHSQGLVIKVDREFPHFPYMSGKCPVCGGNLERVPSTWGEGGGLYCKGNCNCYVATEKYCRLFMLKAGYVAVEPLIEEK